VLLIQIPQTYPIAENLKLAEREVNALLRAWGGGLQKDPRQNMAKERADWLDMIPSSNPEVMKDLYKHFYDTNQKELAGGSQADNLGKARGIAFLLREVYEGNVRNAQIKLLNEIRNGTAKPFMVSGLRDILDYDEIVRTGQLPNRYIGWGLMTFAVKMHGFPHEILMVKADKSYKRNWDVINELTRPLQP
jgi:hypothetical protein